MAKFHINANGEVKPCRAQVRCRFGGASGKENHFDSKEAADKAVQEKYAKEFGETKAVRKTPASARETLQELSSRGVRVKTITSVRDYDFSKSMDAKVSNIDVLDEKAPKELMKAIRKGATRAF